MTYKKKDMVNQILTKVWQQKRVTLSQYYVISKEKACYKYPQTLRYLYYKLLLRVAGGITSILLAVVLKYLLKLNQALFYIISFDWIIKIELFILEEESGVPKAYDSGLSSDHPAGESSNYRKYQ